MEGASLTLYRRLQSQHICLMGGCGTHDRLGAQGNTHLLMGAPTRHQISEAFCRKDVLAEEGEQQQVS